MLQGIVYAICGLVGVVYLNRYIRAVASQDRSVPDPISAGFEMREHPGRVVSISASTTLKYLRALGRRQADEDLEGLRRVTLFWLSLAILAFAWLVVS